MIELTEYKTKRFAEKEIAYETGTQLYEKYRDQIDVEFPSPKTNFNWGLTSNGWVGYIPLSANDGVRLSPKVDLQNIFRMLDYAYRLKSFKMLEGIAQCESISEFFQKLASILARRVNDRAKKGFYRSYLNEFERRTYLKGKLDLGPMIRTPWSHHLWCRYQTHTADIIENQILCWTLHCIARSGLCSEEIAPEIRNAYRSLQHLVRLTPFSPDECVARLYNRLNSDYEPLHMLCRFFLEHSGPVLNAGSHSMIPFLIDMSRLFELFVAEWLAAHLPERYSIVSQEHVNIGANDELKFNIDLVIYKRESNRPVCVLDTKYKDQAQVANDDFNQIHTYAILKDCSNAVLIYPKKLASPLDQTLRGVRIRSLVFSLNGDLEQSGNDFLKALSHSLGN